jgi:subtilisin family serine protease
MRKITSVILLLGCALSAGAQQTVRNTVRYIVQLQSPPILSTHGERAALDRIEREHSDFEARAVAAGFTVIRRLTHVANIAIVEAPVGNAGRLRGMTGVKRAFQERRYQQHFDASISLHQIDAAWAAIPGATYNPSNPSGWNVAGQGVKIGMIDTGIDPTHPSFSASNMPAPPSGFPKWSTNVTGNQALTSNKIIVARSYGTWTAQDVDGHGTATASVAAGVPISSSVGPNGMTLSGVAPAAWLGIYDVDSDHTGSYADSDILSALDDCATDGMDVVSMSFGAPDYGGSLDPENQLYDEIFTTLRANGTVLVASAGNDGSEVDTMAAPAVDPGVIAAGAQQSTTLSTSPAVTATDGTNISAAAADNNTSIVPALTAPLVNVTKWDTTGLGCNALPSGVAKGEILLIQRGNCNFSVKVQNAQTAGAVAVIVYNVAASSDTTSGDYLVNMDLSAATPLSSVANFPALFIGYDDGQTLISKVGSGSSYSVTAMFGLGQGDTHQLADFSSRGPDADLAIKPDLVADGNSVVTAWCTNLTLDVNNNACDPFGFQLMDGTSFSAPLTAGAVALVKSARPGLTADDYRSLVVNGASPMTDDSGNTMPVQQAGAGSLDVLQAVKSTVTANPVSLSFGAAGSSVATTQQLTLKNVGTATTTYNLSFEGVATSTVAGSPVTLASGGTVYMPLPSQIFGDYLGLSNPLPTLWTRSVTLAAGAETTVVVQAPPAQVAQGPYQGFIDVTASGSSTPEARIPWWFAVTASTPTAIALDCPDGCPLDLSYDSSTGYYDATIAVRFVDSTGVMLAPSSTPSVISVSGGAVASAPYQATSASTCETTCATVVFPNVWLIDITAPYYAETGDTYTFRITSGGLARDFTAYVY